MRSLAVVLALVAGALLLTSARPDPACATGTCPAIACYSSSVCLSDCFCFRQGPGPGVCSSID